MPWSGASWNICGTGRERNNDSAPPCGFFKVKYGWDFLIIRVLQKLCCNMSKNMNWKTVRQKQTNKKLLLCLLSCTDRFAHPGCDVCPASILPCWTRPSRSLVRWPSSSPTRWGQGRTRIQTPPTLRDTHTEWRWLSCTFGSHGNTCWASSCRSTESFPSLWWTTLRAVSDFTPQKCSSIISELPFLFFLESKLPTWAELVLAPN